jgi:hypothetical protein
MSIIGQLPPCATKSTRLLADKPIVDSQTIRFCR